ncbi:hypothetical protein Q7P37_004780 [Cladosporium fusiforme]
MQYSQHQQPAQQYMPHPQPQMQQYQNPNQPFPSPRPNSYTQQPPRHQPPPPMRMVDKTIYNAQTNQALYTWSISKDPSTDVPESLLSLQHAPTGVLVGSTQRGDPQGASTLFGNCNCNCCSCCAPDPIEDVISVGVHGAKARISDVGTGRTAWGWKTTWSNGAEQWMFVKGGGVEGRLVLKDAVSTGEEVLRVEDSGEIRFSQKGMGLSESMVGEIMLVLATISIEREESRWSWLLDLLTF